MNSISMKLNADKLIMQALEEDITSEDITTNAVMRHPQQGEVQLLCKQDGVIAGLDVFKRVFELLDETTEVVFYVKDGDAVKKGDLLGGVKGYAPFVRKIEVEVENLDMVREAVEAGADIIMLDNMTPEMMKEAVRIIDGRAETECSGNVTLENVARLTDIGVDYISSGALTHSAPILDVSLKNLHAV